jgi:phosphonate transport system ATP-binding protein
MRTSTRSRTSPLNLASSTCNEPNGEAFALEGVHVDFGRVQALSDISLRIAPGEAVGFVGPSGSGKTTLLRVLNGTVRPSSGRVLVDGTDLAQARGKELKRIRSHVGFVHQDLGLVPNVRVAQNVLAGQLGRMGFVRSLRHMLLPRRQDLAFVHSLLDRVGIPEKLFARTDTLSGGQQQRVAVARALFQEPGALLADEPVSSVDPARARDTVALLGRVSRESALTLCMSLHNLELARGYFPRLIGLRGGRIVFDKPSEQIGEAEFQALYNLSDDEMLADGA